jgi:predicted RNA-binding protein with PUA-like domain
VKYWLVNFAPFRDSWQDILGSGKFEIYSSRSAVGRNKIKVIKVGDEVLFYRSQEGTEIMGVMKVIEEAHQAKTPKNQDAVPDDINDLKNQ